MHSQGVCFIFPLTRRRKPLVHGIHPVSVNFLRP
nr:MAG TPA: hypothetical protein [Caudoviricetes sp.]